MKWNRALYPKFNAIRRYSSFVNIKLEHVKYYVKRAIEYGEYRLDTFIPKSFADATKQEAIDIINKTQEFAVDELNMELEAVQLTCHEQQAFNDYYDKYK